MTPSPEQSDPQTVAGQLWIILDEAFKRLNSQWAGSRQRTILRATVINAFRDAEADAEKRGAERARAVKVENAFVREMVVGEREALSAIEVAEAGRITDA